MKAKSKKKVVPAWLITVLIAGIYLVPPLRAGAQVGFDDEWVDPWFEMPQPLHRVTTVVLDPGHGGSDSGLSANGLVEKKLALQIADEAARRITKELGARVVLTREDDSAVSTSERVAIANYARADLLVSLHASSSASPEARGVTVYYHSPDTAGRRRKNVASAGGLQAVPWNEAGSPHMADSAQLASLLAASIGESTGLPIAGIHPAPLAPLVGADMPAVLIEVGYLSNTQDADALSDERVRVLMADAIRQAILDYDAAQAEESNP